MDESIKVAKTDEVTNISTKGPMLFIPQKLTEWDLKGNIYATATAKQSYLKITCKIKQSGAYLFGGDTTFDELYVPFGADWQPGKRYIYTLIFGGGYNAQGQAIFQPINFKAEVGKWEDADATINVNKYSNHLKKIPGRSIISLPGIVLLSLSHFVLEIRVKRVC